MIDTCYSNKEETIEFVSDKKRTRIGRKRTEVGKMKMPKIIDKDFIVYRTIFRGMVEFYKDAFKPYCKVFQDYRKRGQKPPQTMHEMIRDFSAKAFEDTLPP
jgi:hypothetical protein